MAYVNESTGPNPLRRNTTTGAEAKEIVNSAGTSYLSTGAPASYAVGGGPNPQLRNTTTGAQAVELVDNAGTSLTLALTNANGNVAAPVIVVGAVVTPATSVVLTAANNGDAFSNQGWLLPSVFTMPISSTLTPGWAVDIWNLTTYGASIGVQGADVLDYYGSATCSTTTPGSKIRVTWTGLKFEATI